MSERVSHATKRTDGRRGSGGSRKKIGGDGRTDADDGSGGAAPRERRRASYNTGWPHGRAIGHYLLISIAIFRCDDQDDHQ